MKKYKYEELYPKDFLDYFGKNKDRIAKLEVNSNDFSIDVDKIIKCLDLQEEDMIISGKSGHYDPQKQEIYVNILEPYKRQRFTKAHEIGHFVLGHGESDREDYTINSDIKERAANQFAAELLMPEKLRP